MKINKCIYILLNKYDEVHVIKFQFLKKFKSQARLIKYVSPYKL